ncbi:hypothetical protein HK405_015794 [Cladochytrium tenue]|nr:hypothetical protein HK405_015794 [Cladochytrium tenue]
MSRPSAFAFAVCTWRVLLLRTLCIAVLTASLVVAPPPIGTAIKQLQRVYVQEASAALTGYKKILSPSAYSIAAPTLQAIITKVPTIEDEETLKSMRKITNGLFTNVQELAKDGNAVCTKDFIDLHVRKAGIYENAGFNSLPVAKQATIASTISVVNAFKGAAASPCETIKFCGRVIRAKIPGCDPNGGASHSFRAGRRRPRGSFRAGAAVRAHA